MDLFTLGLIQNSLNGGKNKNGSASYTISNAVDYPLLGLSLYGRSEQDGTPSPDNPVDIVSVGDNGFDIVSNSDNAFTVITCQHNNSGIITKQPVSAAVKVGATTTFTIAATGNGLKYQWQVSTDNGRTWVNTGSTGSKTDTITIKAISSWNGKKYRCVVTDENGNSITSNAATLYVISDNCSVKTGCIVLSDELCGIPVDSGGNYTDKNGQQWVCDEFVYNVDGTSSIIKNTAKIDSYNGEAIATPYISTTGALTTGATVLYALAEPQEIALTAADVSALMQLQTYNGVTNITNSDSAEMDVKYCTNRSLSEYVIPIITNMQAQIDDLKSVILNLRGGGSDISEEITIPGGFAETIIGQIVSYPT